MIGDTTDGENIIYGAISRWACAAATIDIGAYWGAGVAAIGFAASAQRIPPMVDAAYRHTTLCALGRLSDFTSCHKYRFESI